jgi:hypothetical protein
MRITVGKLRRLVHEANRNRHTGQYSYENKWDRLCVCGHTLGVHAADAPHPCFNEDAGLKGATGEPCDCQRFKPVRVKKEPVLPSQ